MSRGLRQPGSEDQTLGYTLRVLRERWILIVGVTLACGALAFLLSKSQDKTYEASAKVVFGNANLEEAVTQRASQSAEPEREAATRVLVATSRSVATRAQKDLKTKVDPDTLAAQVTVEAEPNANVLDFTASAAEPRVASALANAFARQYIEFERANDLQKIGEAEKSYRRRLANLTPGSVAYTEIQQSLSRLADLRDVGLSDSQIITEARAPSSPASPKPKRDLVLGLIVGALLGLTLAFLLDLLDRRIKTIADFERLYGMRALASVPRTSFTVPYSELTTPAFEPYRILRTAISFAEARHDTSVILVTSAIADEGKSSVALNLTRALAQSGQPAILLEADLRRPSIARRLGIDDRDGGLTTALTGRHRARDLLREIPGERGSGALVLPAGPLAPNAPQMLSAARMDEVLEELSNGPEVVIVDAAPLVPVADTQVLLDAPRIGATLLVGRAFQTKREDIGHCRSILDQHESITLGVVVTGLDPAVGYEYARTPGSSSRSEAPERGAVTQ
ncbi:MAG: hypothetical protein JHC95_23170 [Solirubrobacteraceae bacterium]|nr:hypothetical protein [Solirubrobacteraceae bacterium]